MDRGAWWVTVHEAAKKLCTTEQLNNNIGVLIITHKLEIPKEYFMQRWAQYRTEMVMNLTEAEGIKKWWQEYTEKLYKKDLHDPDNHNGVITNLQQDILECKVKQAFRSITMNKASGGDGIPPQLFENLKDSAVKVLYSICEKINLIL